MPWRKRLLLAAALGALGAGLVAAALLARAGWPWAGAGLAAALAAAALLAGDALWERLDLLGATLVAGDRARPEVALTFDDGPGPDTEAVLDALDAAGVRATFFVLGRAAEARPDVVREVARRGHLVALHGHTHRQLHLASGRTAAGELDRCADAIRAAGVEPAPFFRAPHGRKGFPLRRALRARGLRLVAWTRGVWDTERPGAAAIAARACARPRGGEILLLHDGCGEAAAGRVPAAGRREQTAAAIPEIARRWHEAGFRFVTLAELQAPPRAARGGRALRAVVLAGLAVSAAHAAGSLDLAAARRALAAARPGPLLAAGVANLAALAAQALRWHALVRAGTPGARLRDTARALVGGFAIGLVAPARAGDVARVHLHARASGAPAGRLAATVALDHLLGAATLLAALAAVGAFVPLPPWARAGAGLTAAVAGAGGLAAWLAASGRGGEGGEGGPAASWLGRLVATVRAGLSVGPRALALAFAAGLAGWALESAVAAAALAAFDLPVTALSASVAVLATTFASAAAVLPANAGGFELSAAISLGALGIPAEQALVFALGYHAAHLVPVAIAGLLCVRAPRAAPARASRPPGRPRSAPAGD